MPGVWGGLQACDALLFQPSVQRMPWLAGASSRKDDDEDPCLRFSIYLTR